MHWSTPVLLIGIAFGLQFFIKYRDWMGLSKGVVYRTAPGECTTVIEGGGSEDIVNIGNNIILISTRFNLAAYVGEIKALDLKTNKVWTMKITNTPSRPDFMAGPHGMDTWKDEKTGEHFLYLVTHPVKEDRIEVFKIKDHTTLQYVKTITDPSFKVMNDLVVVGKDKFYITISVRFREQPYITMEIYGWMHNGAVLYYDGNKAREVVGGLLIANGINISPDKSMIYMAEFGNKKLVGYRRESSNDLVKAWDIDLDTGVDNINVDPVTGDLWLGCHPYLYKAIDMYNWFGLTKPSQVLRVKIRDQAVSEVSQVYADSGHEIKGTSVAFYTNGKLVIGSVAHQMIVCDINYLSP